MALSTVPSYPHVGSTVYLYSTSAMGQFQEFELTGLPPFSGYSTGLITNASGSAVNYLEIDAPGTYTLRIWDYRYIEGSPRFDGSRDTGLQQYALSATSVTFQAGEELEVPVLTRNGDGATLSILVTDYSIRSAAFYNFVNTKSEAAAAVSAITNALTSVIDLEISTAATDVVVIANSLINKYNTHLTNTLIHSAADSTNSFAPTAPESVDAATYALNTFVSKLTDHQSKRRLTSSDWHIADDVAVEITAARADDIRGAYALAVDAANVYKQHVRSSISAFLGSTVVHLSAVTYSSSDFDGFVNSSTFDPRRFGWWVYGNGSYFYIGSTLSVVGIDAYGESVIETSVMDNESGYAIVGDTWWTKINKVTVGGQDSTSGAWYELGFYNASHFSTISSHDIAEPKAMDRLINAYLGQLKTFYPRPQASEPSGIVEAQNRLGFRRTIG